MIALVFFGTYLLMFIALSMEGETELFGRRVDLSYGIYLYGWPVQQLLIHAFGTGLSPPVLFVVSLGLTALIALASWLVIEQPALDWARAWERSRRRRGSMTPA